jgi:hypothetical protein
VGGAPEAQRQQSTRCGPELTIAAVAIVAAAAAGYALAGPMAIALVAMISGVAGLILLRFLLPPQAAGPAGEDLSGPDPAVPPPVLSTFTGTWRRQSRLADAQASRPAYEAGLRPQLEHLLASRLAERHGISLYDDPDAARDAFTGGQPGYAGLWTWIDPARPAVTGQAGDLPGIPFRALARIIDRLERL